MKSLIVLFLLSTPQLCLAQRIVNPVWLSYPLVASNAGAQGSVELQAVVNKSGRVDKIEIVGGNPTFMGVSRENLKKWIFSPSDKSETVKVKFVFVLDSRINGTRMEFDHRTMIVTITTSRPQVNP